MKWKKILCLGMTAVLLSVNPAMLGNVQEAESGLNTPGNMETTDPFKGEYAYKELEDGTLSIIGYRGSESDIVIPAEHNGRKVTRIDGVAGEYGCKSLDKCKYSGRNKSNRGICFSALLGTGRSPYSEYGNIDRRQCICWCRY